MCGAAGILRKRMVVQHIGCKAAEVLKAYIAK